jgi:hypothetical protein
MRVYVSSSLSNSLIQSHSELEVLSIEKFSAKNFKLKLFPDLNSQILVYKKIQQEKCTGKN